MDLHFERRMNMIKKYWKLLLLTSIIILLPVLAGLMLWDQLPQQVPCHWNLNGEVDGWCGKGVVVFGMPFLMLAVQFICLLATAADPKRKNHPEKVLQLVLWIIPILSVVLLAVTYAVALGEEVRIEKVTPVLLGLILTVVGNYMPKCKQNYTIGIKIPWTLHSEENWNRTHRFAGRLWVICGLCITVTGFLGCFRYAIPFALLMVLVPVLYSYLLHRKGI